MSPHPDPTDPTALALSLRELEGRVESMNHVLTMMQQQSSQANMNLTNGLAALAADVRHLPDRLRADLDPVTAKVTLLGEHVSSYRLATRVLWAVVVVLVAVSIPAISGWISTINNRFGDEKNERLRLEAQRVKIHESDVARLEVKIERVGADVESLKETRYAR